MTSGPPHLFGSWRRRSHSFLRRVVQKAEEDGIFFMAGAISFNVLVAIVPLVLFAVGVAGLVLRSRFGEPEEILTGFLLENLPVLGGDLELVTRIGRELADFLAAGKSFTILGAILLLWFASRLVGTLRTVLREIFDIGTARGIVWGKIFDMGIVAFGGALFLLNIGTTAVLRAGRDFGVSLLGLEGQALNLVQRASVQGLAVIAIWLLFLGVYRFLPHRPVPWRTALIAATFASVVHEVLKSGFGWYVSEIADYRSTYGNLISLAVLFFWIYYEAIGFILGGEVAQVWTMREARRVQIRDVMGGVS